MIPLNSASIQIQPGSTISGIVAGFIDNGDDFTLNFSGGSAIVDSSPLNANQLGLNIGEPVNVVVAEFDGIEIDTGFITRPDGSIILGNQPSFTPPPPPMASDPLQASPFNPPPPPMAPDPITGGIPSPFPSGGFDPLIARQANPIFGTVVGIVDNDEFFLDANGTQVLVDADLPDFQFLNLMPGEQVNVVGQMDESGFDAFSITRADGSSVLPNLTSIPMPTNSMSPVAPVGNTLFGTVLNTVDNDEFFLNANGTQVLVDADLPDSQFLNLAPGEQVNVVGILDDEDFDAFSITRADGSVVFPNTPVSPVIFPTNPVNFPTNPISFGATLSGTVVSYVDDNEFLLQTNNGVVVVDPGPPWWQPVNLNIGEPVTVVGELDDDDFDAFSIARADGSVIPIRSGPGRPPWAGGPNQNNGFDFDDD